MFSTIVPRKNILFYEDGREEAECVIFEHGEVSRFELDSFEEKECVRDSASSILEEASLHARGSTGQDGAKKKASRSLAAGAAHRHPG